MKKEDRPDLSKQLIELRETTGMSRMRFAKYFGIPYRTMCDWESGARNITDYVLDLMEYKVKGEKLDINNLADSDQKED